MLVKGRSKSYIAETLFISENTVRSHSKHIYQKLGVHSKQEVLDLLVLATEMPPRIVPPAATVRPFSSATLSGFARILNDLGKRPYHPLRVIGVLRENTPFVY